MTESHETWVRPLPYPYTHFFTVANDCDSASFGTTRKISDYLRSEGIELSDSFFSQSRRGSVSPLLEGRENSDSDDSATPEFQEFLKLSDSTLLDQIHGVTESAKTLRWNPIVIYPCDEAIKKSYSSSEQFGIDYGRTHSISFWCRVPSGCQELEVSFSDSRGIDYLITTNELPPDRLGWRIAIQGAQPEKIEIDCENINPIPLDFRDITVSVRTQSTEAIVIAGFTASNIGRPAIRRLFQRLKQAGVVSQVLTAHGQPGDLTEISSYPYRPRLPADSDSSGPSILDLLAFLNSEGRKTAHVIDLGHPDCYQVLETLFLSSLGRDRGNSRWSGFYCADILKEFGISFIRSYFAESSAPCSLENLIEKHEKNGIQFYIFRAYSPSGFGESPLNQNLGRQIELAVDEIESSPPFSGVSLYTHWGNSIDERAPHIFNDATRKSFERIGALAKGPNASLFVRPVSVMLRYASFIRGLRRLISFEGESNILRCRSWEDEITREKFDASHEFVRGLSFFVKKSKGVKVFWEETEMPHNMRSSKDDENDIIQLQ